MKKGLIIFCLTVYIFASLFVLPARRAEAALPAVVAAGAAGSEIAVGAYVLAGLTIASFGAAVGYEHADAIKSYSLNVWKNANQVIKDSMKASIDAAVAAGSSIVHISSDVVGYIQDAVRSGIAYFKDSGQVQISSSPSLNVGSLSFGSTRYGVNALYGFEFLVYSPSQQKYFRTDWIYAEKSTSPDGVRIWDGYKTFHFVAGASLPALTRTYDIVKDARQVLDLISSFGVQALIVPVSYSTPAVPNVDDIPSYSIDGVYVPDEIRAYPVDSAGARVSDVPLSWNPQSRIWERTDVPGTTWTGSVEWDFPVPTINEDGKVVVGDTVAVGEGVGTKVGTGEEVGTGEGFLQDILTGVRTIADTLTTGLVGNPENINWDKLKMAGSAFTTSFPFSIPWDVGRALDAAFGSVEELEDAPTWEWKINLLGQQYPIRFKIDDYFLEWFGIIRSVMLIMFDIGLVYAVRKMLGGAS
ncbi:hypothetical protein ACNR9V_20660 (plasmid) [Parageobacillus thermoglucosidasius]|uniref:hypothetical protein n=1 Tax=Parageobacillus thermoglucosidasius TaxID=1426 RepID=UPI003B67BE73